MKQPFFACDRCLSDEFVKIAGNNAEGVVCLYPWNPCPARRKAVGLPRRRFRDEFEEEPETYAAHAYDGMNMLIWATQVAGLNRAKIRDVIAYRTEPWKGVTGDIPLGAVLDDLGEVFLAKRERGAWKFYSRKDLKLPRDIKSEPPQSETQIPYLDRRVKPTQYAGSGREMEPPQDLKEIRIGYFGPPDPKHPEGGDAWVAAQMAVAEANRAGGYHGKPFRLVPVWSKDSWNAGVTALARQVYDQQLWAIIGGIDGTSTHLAEQITVKACLPLVSPFSTDRTVHGANQPWMFSCTPSDDLQAPVLAEEMATRLGDRPFAIVSSTEHDPRQFVTELDKSLTRQHLAPRYRFEFQEGTPNEGGVITRVVDSRCEAIVLAASAQESGRLLKGLRAAGFRGQVFGSPTLGCRQFVQQAGSAAEGVVFPLLFQPQKGSEAFVQAFTRRGEPLRTTPRFTRMMLFAFWRRPFKKRVRTEHGFRTPCAICPPGKELPGPFPGTTLGAISRRCL